MAWWPVLVLMVSQVKHAKWSRPPVLVLPIPVKTEAAVARMRTRASTKRALHALQEHAKTLFVHSIRSAAEARGTHTALHAPMAKSFSVRIAARP